MTLAALIAAYQDSEAPEGGLRATLPLAGRTVVERQARLAAAAGADPVVILVERVPPALLAAIDRMHAEAVRVEVARSAAEAAGMIPADARLLLVADGLVADAAQIGRLVDAGAPAILTLPDRFGDARYERIDSQSLWAGLALLEGGTLRETAAMLGDWDLQSTLLRQAAGEGARRLPLGADPAAAGLIAARSAEDLGALHAHIVERAGAPSGGWISRCLLAPAEAFLTRLLLPRSVAPGWLHLAAAALLALAALFFVEGWLAAGLALLLVATPLEGSARRLAALLMQDAAPPDWWRYGRPALAGLALLSLGYALSGTQGWGCLVLAAVTVAFLTALHIEASGRAITGAFWLAEARAMAWLLLPFALLGNWVAGLGLLACYAAGSFFWAQHHAHAPGGAPAAD